MTKPLVKLEELVDPSRAALLVIDIQKDFCASYLSTRDVTSTSLMLPRLIDFVKTARAAGVQVVNIKTEHPDETNTPSWLARKWTPSGQRPELCRPGTEGAEFMPGFEPQPGDLVVTKYRYSGFIGTNLNMVLKTIGAETIIATGTASNNCVEATARDGFMLDYYLVFVSDGTSSYDDRLHEATLTSIRNHYGTVASIAEIEACWRSATSTAVSEEKQAAVAV